MNPDHFSKDVGYFLSRLFKSRVRYLLVGGEAVIFYGYPRSTGDIDIYYDVSPDNVDRLWDALKTFWENDIPGLHDKTELSENNAVFQFGVPPNRIDLLNSIDGVRFNTAWKNRIEEEMITEEGTIQVYYIGLDELIHNKKAVSRNRDLDDLQYLERIKDLKRKPYT